MLTQTRKENLRVSIRYGQMGRSTLFSKKTAYAALVVSCPSKKRGNCTVFNGERDDVFDEEPENDESTEGAGSMI